MLQQWQIHCKRTSLQYSAFHEGLLTYEQRRSRISEATLAEAASGAAWENTRDQRNNGHLSDTFSSTGTLEEETHLTRFRIEKGVMT